jgi:hypothetical protein
LPPPAGSPAWSTTTDRRQHTSYRYLLRRLDTGRLGIQVVIDTTPA